ncbi:MAG: Secreted protein containing DUF192 [uncultured bacterium]|nr:MAG: Secreted protein containing DUF192 [uncultured bacterium]
MLKFNRKKVITLFFAVLIFLLVVFYISTRFYSFYGNNIIPVKVGKQVFYVEVVSSREKLEKGLGGRERLCDSCGMLFKFETAGIHSFWMKDMMIPLDMIWIHEGRIVHIEKEIPFTFKSTLRSPMNSDAVLEINAGKADEAGINVGDQVLLD